MAIEIRRTVWDSCTPAIASTQQSHQRRRKFPEANKRIHPALKKGFLAIYGYTSDEKGIRHPLLEKDDSDAAEAEALFMIGAASAFVSYLLNRRTIAE